MNPEDEATVVIAPPPPPPAQTVEEAQAAVESYKRELAEAKDAYREVSAAHDAAYRELADAQYRHRRAEDVLRAVKRGRPTGTRATDEHPDFPGGQRVPPEAL